MNIGLFLYSIKNIFIVNIVIMHFELRANDNSTHRNSDGKSCLEYFLTFIIYRRAKCTFKVTPGYAFRGRVYQPTFVKFSYSRAYSITLAISQLISGSVHQIDSMYRTGIWKNCYQKVVF